MQTGPQPDLPLLILSVVPRSEAGARALMALSARAERVPDIAAAQARLAAVPGARLVLLCPRPEIWVALALADGMAPSRAVAEWQAALRGVMAGLRQQRRRTTVIFDHSLATAAPGCAAALGLEWGDRPVPDLPPADPVLTVIARDALRQDAAAHALAAELEATAFVPDGVEPVFEVDPDLVFAGYHAGLQDQAEARIRLTAQIETLAETLAEAHAKALSEAQTKMQTKMQAEVQAVKAAGDAGADLLRDQIRLETAARQEAQAALAAETEQVRTLRTALEAAEAEARLRAERDAAALAAAQDAARAEAEALKTRLAAQAETLAETRAARDRDLAAAAQDAAQAAEAAAKAAREADLLRDQIRLESAALHEAQAALVAQTSAAQALRDSLRAREAEHARLRAGLEAAEAEARLRAERDAAAQAAAQAEIHRLKAALADRVMQVETLVQVTATRKRELAAAAEAAEQAATEAAATADLLRDQIRLQATALHEAQAALAAQARRAAEAEAAHAGLQAASALQREEAERALVQARDEAQAAIRQLRDQLYQMGQGLESYHAQLDAMQIERQDLLARIRQLHEIREALEGYFDQARHLAGQVEALEAEGARLRGALDTGQAALDERTRHVDWLQGELQQIHRSRSYRLMSPLRRMRVALRGAG